jgi:hypothetical protein
VARVNLAPARVVACVAMQDLAFATLVELSAALESRRLSPIDLAEALLARIARRDPALHAFVAVYADEARLAARQTSYGAALRFRTEAAMFAALDRIDYRGFTSIKVYRHSWKAGAESSIRYLHDLLKGEGGDREI